MWRVGEIKWAPRGYASINRQYLNDGDAENQRYTGAAGTTSLKQVSTAELQQQATSSFLLLARRQCRNEGSEEPHDQTIFTALLAFMLFQQLTRLHYRHHVPERTLHRADILAGNNTPNR